LAGGAAIAIDDDVRLLRAAKWIAARVGDADKA
jgi:hypothetical protein